MVSKTATVSVVVTIFVALLVGSIFIEPIADEVEDVTRDGANATNVTGASETIVNLLPLFFVIVLLASAVKWGSKFW